MSERAPSTLDRVSYLLGGARDHPNLRQEGGREGVPPFGNYNRNKVQVHLGSSLFSFSSYYRTREGEGRGEPGFAVERRMNQVVVQEISGGPSKARAFSPSRSLITPDGIDDATPAAVPSPRTPLVALPSASIAQFADTSLSIGWVGGPFPWDPRDPRAEERTLPGDDSRREKDRAREMVKRIEASSSR